MGNTKLRIDVLLALFILIFARASLSQNSYRDFLLKPDSIMTVIGVKPGMVIGEAGAGRGYFTFKLSARVGEKGKIYANDIDGNALKSIQDKCEADHIGNITTIVGQVADPLFPKGELDMVFMIAAFHDFAKPVEWLHNVIPSMKSGAALIMVETDPDKLDRKTDHYLTRDRIITLAEQGGFKLVGIYDFLARDTIYKFKVKE